MLVDQIGGVDFVCGDFVMNSKNIICFWYDSVVLEVVIFYVEMFFDSVVLVVYCVFGDYFFGKEGDVLMVEFWVMGIFCFGFNGGLVFCYSEVFFFQVVIDDQVEIDCLWNVIVDNGGEESVCGWCCDKWGIFWQIILCVFSEVIVSFDCVVVRCVFEVMMMMGRIDIVIIEKVFKG